MYMYALRFKWLSPILFMVVSLAGFRDGFEIMYHAHENITQNFCYGYLTLLIQCFFIRMDIVCVNGRFNMLGCSRFRYTILQFRFIRFGKATSYL